MQLGRASDDESIFTSSPQDASLGTGAVPRFLGHADASPPKLKPGRLAAAGTVARRPEGSPRPQKLPPASQVPCFQCLGSGSKAGVCSRAAQKAASSILVVCDDRNQGGGERQLKRQECPSDN